MSHTLKEVFEHNMADSCWIVIDGHIFDVTSYLSDHPGGRDVLLKVAGEDATEAFNEVNHVDGIRMMEKYCIGKVRE